MSYLSLHLYGLTLLTIVIKLVCLLVTIAYFTLAERKIMAAVQRRHGPDVVGFWGLLQPLADGLKLFAKELVIPTSSNSRLFISAPMAVLALAFLSWAVIPFHLFDHMEFAPTELTSRLVVATVNNGNEMKSTAFTSWVSATLVNELRHLLSIYMEYVDFVSELNLPKYLNTILYLPLVCAVPCLFAFYAPLMTFFIVAGFILWLVALKLALSLVSWAEGKA